MALAAGVPVIPVAMVDSELDRKVLGIPWADHPVVRVGEPLDFSRYNGREDERAVTRWVTDEIMTAIQQLGGQTYVDAYGTSVKYGSMTAEEAARRVKERPGDGKPAPA